MHHYQDLIHIFDDCFFDQYNTRLVKGDDEPIYLPADQHRSYHALCFAHGFFSSALHETSHWLIAGEHRRTQVDFGYWYEPDGRNAQQQALFAQVEVKPQAIEWILSAAANYPFRVSLDNLNGEPIDASAFKQAICQQVHTYCARGLSPRAEQFRQALSRFYKTNQELSPKYFSVETIG